MSNEPPTATPTTTSTTTASDLPSETETMNIDPSRARALVSQLHAVQQRILSASSSSSPSSSAPPSVRLVAVSKLKPANDILALHADPAARHVHFGENYAQELGAKAELLPRTICWHFIGGLQSTHCKSLARIPNLWCVSSIDTLKKATLLSKHRAELISSSSSSSSSEPVPKLNVHVQVNTSGEATKSGCPPGAPTIALCRAIVADCPTLNLLGLMTIGAIARSRASAGDDNEDFVLLREQRDLVARELGRDPESLELSMGMSEDFENAIALGSAEVRVGSTIFGERPAKADAKIVEA